MFGPTLARHVRYSRNPWFFNDDVRQQIFPFFRYYDATPVSGDYFGDYYLACYPWGYRALYTVLAYLGVDPAALSKAIVYVLLAIIVLGVGLTARRIGGKVAAWVAMALVLSTGLYLARITGGLPRSFAFPLLAAAIATLAHGKIRLSGLLVLLGAAFYPAGGVMVGLSLAVVLFILPAKDRGEAQAWSRKRRALFLGGASSSAERRAVRAAPARAHGAAPGGLGALGGVR
jgi:hypothetical protein